MELSVVVYTMKGCPFCDEFKTMLKESKIDFIDRDIDKYNDEYSLFSEITKNDMIPAILIVEGDSKNHQSYLYVPEKDYDQLSEALDIVKSHRNKMNII